MSSIDNNDITGAVERLAAAFPWDKVELDIHREPQGNYYFVAWVPQNEKFGFPSIIGTDNSLTAAVDKAIAQVGGRDPEIARQNKIRELQEAIVKLQAVVIGLPPYRPGRELGRIPSPVSVDV